MDASEATEETTQIAKMSQMIESKQLSKIDSEKIILWCKYRWKLERHNTINAADLSWNDIGFDEKPEEFATVNEYLEKEGELNTEQFAKITVIDQFLEDLDMILQVIKNNK